MSTMIPSIGSAQISLLEKLSNACAVSGDEGQVRRIVLDEIRADADELRVDALGNVLAVRKSNLENPLRVLVDAHMDEIGFMIVEDDKEGLFRFDLVGGIDVRVLPGKIVLVGKDNVLGVIGAKPIHLMEEGETSRKIPLDTLRIDVGQNGSKVKIGDRATFATRFRQLGPSLVGKAIDNRIGIATLIELVKNPPENIELLASFSVQEEIGLRGARVAAYAHNPDMAIAIDSTPALDLPTWDDSENSGYNTRLGAGPAIYIADGGTLADPRLVRHLAQTGETAGIPYQFRQPGGGGTNAGAIHKTRAGVPTASVSVPGRYAHTAATIARLVDWENTLALVYQSLLHLNRSLFSVER